MDRLSLGKLGFWGAELQANHETDGQLRTASIAAPAADHNLAGTEHVFGFENLTAAVWVLELGSDARFDLASGQPGGQYRQRIAQVDHSVDSAAKEVNGLHVKSLRKLLLHNHFLRDFTSTKPTFIQ